MKAIFLTSNQLDNMYRMDLPRYVNENRDKLVEFDSPDAMTENNERLPFGIGEYWDVTMFVK